MLDVVAAAVMYSEEMDRKDVAHNGRLSQRENALRATIKDAAKAMKSGPVSKEGLEFAERMLVLHGDD